MNSIRAVIIDDEEGARESLANILSKYCEDVEVEGKAGSAASGYALIKEKQPDLVFLDIEMPRGNAFDLLSKFEEIDFDLIFITAYDQYAIKAIKFSALDYLLKPIDIDELKEAVQKYREKSKFPSSAERLKVLMQNLKSDAGNKKVAIPDSDGLVFIRLDEIIRCESDGNYTNIILEDNKKILACKTLGEYEELFSDENFFRVHRSHLVHLDKIDKYIKGEGGYVVMADGSQVEVSRRKKPEFLKQLSIQ